MAKYLKTKVAPQLPSELRDAFVEQIETGDIRSMPNRSIPASPLPTPGAILLGDAFNMRHPLTGGGMTVGVLPKFYGEEFENLTALSEKLRSDYAFGHTLSSKFIPRGEYVSKPTLRLLSHLMN